MKPHLRLIALVGLIVPRRLRADWRQEWEAELRYREMLLAEWDRLDWRSKLDLLRRSASAFRDALLLQPRRLEDDMYQDVRFGVRMALKNPGFMLVALVTLALGIGANTAIFSLVYALLLRPLGGVADPERLVQVGRKYEDRNSLSDSSYPDYVDYREQNKVMSGLAMLSPTAFHLSTGQEAERVEGEWVSGNYFDVLGVRAAQGRLITAADEERAGSGPVAVLSYRLWQRRFGGEPGVVGKTIKLDAHDFTVVGVASEDFEGTKVGAPRDVWAPILALRQHDPKAANLFGQRRASWLEMFGRLGPGVTLEQARAELEASPGVQAAGFAVTLPLNDGRWENAVYPGGEDNRRVQTFFNFISPRYLETLSIPLLLGRQFSDHDGAAAPPVSIVNETLARRIWPNDSPLGKRLTWKLGPDARQTTEVIGVARDIKGRNLFEPAGPMLYLPLLQTYQASAVLHLRASVEPAQLIPALRHEVSALDRNLPVYSIKPLADHLTATLTPQRLLAYLITGFGLLALLLAGVGLYGLLAYTVAQRTPEMGIRMALGAQPGAVLRLIVGQGMKLAVLGVGLGLAAAFGVTRLLKGVLFGVSALDPLTFAIVALLLVIVALLACYVPARRSARTDPLAALRCE